MKIKSNFEGSLRLSSIGDIVFLKHGEIIELDEKRKKNFAAQVNRHLEAGRLEIVDSIVKEEVQSKEESTEKEEVKADEKESVDRGAEIRKEIKALQVEFKKSKDNEKKKEIKEKVTILKKELTAISK